MTPLTRYILVQTPGWLCLALLLWWAAYNDWIAAWTAALIMAGWILKDAALYPLCKPGFETGPAIGPGALVGRQAKVITALTPEGQIRLNGEFWNARSHDNETISPGQRIRITGTDGLTLIVEPAG
ncbi:MAG: NfeD family protein [Gammaproteobacteria bacterium]|nr:NfeD family protein [Gammaproteobacteria bacterium]